MIKTFQNRQAAEQELTQSGFRKISEGSFYKSGFEAMIHPVRGSELVQVSIQEA